MRFIVLLIIIHLSSFSSYGQHSDTINKIDSSGSKQGYWIIYGYLKPGLNFDRDAIVEEGRFLNNRKQGVWLKYYPNDTLKSKLSFVNGRPNGPYTLYYDNGSVQEQGNWMRNRNIGIYKCYYPNGNLRLHSQFNDKGKREGLQRSYYENGQLLREMWSKDGKAHGPDTRYRADGSIERRTVYFENSPCSQNTDQANISDKGSVQFEYCCFSSTYFDQTVNRDTINQFDSEGLRTGYWEISSDINPTLPDSSPPKLSESGLYRKDLRQGKWNYFNSNCFVDSVITYVDGKRSGRYWIYRAKGSHTAYLKESGVYNNNEAVVELKTYNEKNQLLRHLTFNSDGSLGGAQRFSYSNGKLAPAWLFSDSTNAAVKTYWHKGEYRTDTIPKDVAEVEIRVLIASPPTDPFNKLHTTKQHRTGQWQYTGNMVRTNSSSPFTAKREYADTAIMWECEYDAKGKQGYMTRYYPNGNLKSQEFFVDGVQHGPCKYYYESGELRLLLNKKQGKIEGLRTLYHKNGNLSKRCFLNSRNEYYGRVEVYNEAGVLIEELNYSTHGNLDGSQKYYDENGLLQEEKLIKNKKVEWIKTYWPNGKLKRIEEHRHTIVDQRSRLANETLPSEFSYRNYDEISTLVEKGEVRYNVGRYAERRHIVNGDIEYRRVWILVEHNIGWQEFYDSKGKLRSAIQYANDGRKLCTKHYNRRGKVKQEVEHDLYEY